jgi:hypothetical protein
MSSIREFLYDDQKITFEFNDGQSMVNATQMAKPFGKLPTGFLRGESAKAFVLALEEDYRKNAPPPSVSVERTVKLPSQAVASVLPVGERMEISDFTPAHMSNNKYIRIHLHLIIFFFH